MYTEFFHKEILLAMYTGGGCTFLAPFLDYGDIFPGAPLGPIGFKWIPSDSGEVDFKGLSQAMTDFIVGETKGQKFDRIVAIGEEGNHLANWYADSGPIDSRYQIWNKEAKRTSAEILPRESILILEGTCWDGSNLLQASSYVRGKGAEPYCLTILNPNMGARELLEGTFKAIFTLYWIINKLREWGRINDEYYKQVEKWIVDMRKYFKAPPDTFVVPYDKELAVVK